MATPAARRNSARPTPNRALLDRLAIERERGCDHHPDGMFPLQRFRKDGSEYRVMIPKGDPCGCDGIISMTIHGKVRRVCLEHTDQLN
jgi:hypothetical protein